MICLYFVCVLFHRLSHQFITKEPDVNFLDEEPVQGVSLKILVLALWFGGYLLTNFSISLPAYFVYFFENFIRQGVRLSNFIRRLFPEQFDKDSPVKLVQRNAIFVMDLVYKFKASFQGI
jgi:hypothetical protein